VMHFVSDDERPHEIARTLTRALPPGSYLVLTHVTPDHVSQEAKETALEIYESTSARLTPRSRAEVLRFFDGLELVDPGLVDIRFWHPEIGARLADSSRPTSFYGGVAKKP